VSIAAVIVAAGQGARAGEGAPKQYRALGGRTVLARTLEVFVSHPRIEHVQVVISPGDEPLYRAALGSCAPSAKLADPVPGGATRQQSVLAGLEALAQRASGGEAPALVLVHDAARPFADHPLLDRAIAAGAEAGAAVPGIGVTDTIKIIDARGLVADTPARERLRAVQTPQAFAYASLLETHRKAAEAGLHSFTDDGSLAKWAGLSVAVFEGDPLNIKLTQAGDFVEAERRLGGGQPVLLTRVGTGFDVHALCDGDHIWLGGVRIAATQGVLAHSDGDVVLHALTDAVLGALADGDIGVHFPPSDPQWRGASSDRFLADAVERVSRRGGRIDHLDVTILCESPRIGPHRDAIRERIAAIAGIAVGSVSIKATTTERLGFTGRGEGIAAQASATLRLPETA
jgi:2-C-methyl-D-erythritol 4-phosphate cytidylyltransferase/2-C-methyl-D-erythritol 2,4-cyclodiphosphate synthase